MDGLFKANNSGLFFLVVDNKSNKQVSVKQTVTITTMVYNVSHFTALESCGSDCVLKGFQNNETVIVEYTGPELFVDATVSYGKRTLPKNKQNTFVVLLMLFCALVPAFVILWLTSGKKKASTESIVLCETHRISVEEFLELKKTMSEQDVICTLVHEQNSVF